MAGSIKLYGPSGYTELSAATDAIDNTLILPIDGGEIASKDSPTFTGTVNLPSTTNYNGQNIGRFLGQAAPAFFASASVSSTTNTTFRDMRTFTYSATSQKIISVGATMWNASGSHYWTWRVFNVTKSQAVPILSFGPIINNFISSGGGIDHRLNGITNVHTATSSPYVSFDMTNSDNGDTISVQMSNSDVPGQVLVTSTQQLNMQNLKVFHGIVTGLSGTTNV